jgi:hypothetical protein
MPAMGNRAKDELEAFGPAVATLRRVAEQQESADFFDLWWDGFDLRHALDHRGVWFRSATRDLALNYIRGELRYQAGERGDSDLIDYEIGAFANMAHAVAFATAYLVEEKPLLLIDVPRSVRQGYLPALPGITVHREVVICGR